MRVKYSKEHGQTFPSKLGAEEGILYERCKLHFTHSCIFSSGLHKIRQIFSEIYLKIAISIH